MDTSHGPRRASRRPVESHRHRGLSTTPLDHCLIRLFDRLCHRHVATSERGSLMRRSALILLLALAALAPCSASRADDAELIAAARKEGEVVWYTTLIVSQVIRPLKTAFERKYPGVELQYARADESPTAA